MSSFEAAAKKRDFVSGSRRCGMPTKTTKSKKVTFRLKTESGRKVFVAGTFNNWDAEKNPMKEKRGTGLYSATISLPKGRYEYKFVVDGIWMVDPECPEWVANSFGSLNSVLNVE